MAASLGIVTPEIIPFETKLKLEREDICLVMT